MNWTTDKLALGIATGATLFLLLGIGALGVIGAEGDRADMMFLGVLAIGLGGAVITRLRPEQMVWTMVAMATATMIVGLIAIILGKHNAAESSVAEILGLTGMYASMFAASAWRFRAASQQRRHRSRTHLSGTTS